MTAAIVEVHALAEAERSRVLAGMAALHATAFAQAWSAEEIGRLIDHPGAVALAVSSGTECAAFAIGRVAADEAELLTIVTGERTRRAGLGRALLEAAEVALFERGARVMFLEVAEDNTAAIALYRRAGFAMAGQRRGYYATPSAAAIDALILRKSLAQRDVDAIDASSYNRG